MAISGQFHEGPDCTVSYRDRFSARSPSKHKTVRVRKNTRGAEFTGNLECLVCHGRFKALQRHITRHRMTVQEYKQVFGNNVKWLDDAIWASGMPARQLAGERLHERRRITRICSNSACGKSFDLPHPIRGGAFCSHECYWAMERTISNAGRFKKRT